MFWFIAVCVCIVVLIFSFNLEIATGEEHKAARLLTFFALGMSLGFLFVTQIAV